IWHRRLAATTSRSKPAQPMPRSGKPSLMKSPDASPWLLLVQPIQRLEVLARAFVPRIEPQDFFELLPGFVDAACLGKRDGEIVVRIRRSGVDCESSLETAECFAVAPLIK